MRAVIKKLELCDEPGPIDRDARQMLFKYRCYASLTYYIQPKSFHKRGTHKLRELLK